VLVPLAVIRDLVCARIALALERWAMGDGRWAMTHEHAQRVEALTAVA
jgi:hypothetical protein